MATSPDDSTHFEDAAERRVLDAIEARAVADFSSLPEPQRRLRADFLQRLISGTHGELGQLCCPLRVRGADIIGPLLPPSTGMHAERGALQFRACRFDAPVDLSGADLLVVRLVDCTLPAFIGASLRVGADLDLSGSRFTGISDYESELTQVGACAIHLNNARVGGKLDLSSTGHSRFSTASLVRLDGAQVDGNITLCGARLDGGGPALSARSAIVGGNIELLPVAGHRFESIGEVALSAAQITGDLECSGARLVNPDGRALHCEDIKVESIFLTAKSEAGLPFEALGRLNFLTAVIDGSFFITNARLAPGPDYEGLLRKGGPIALNLQQARISNALALNNIGAFDDDGRAPALDEPISPVRGFFLLTGARVNSILDRTETGWPAPGFLDLEGATYERIRHLGGGGTAERRLAWLRRQFPDGKPDAHTFRPQPYEQLSRVLLQHGQTREANAVAVEKIRMRLEARVDPPAARLFPSLLMLISHYGYSSSRAVLSFIVFVLLGAGMYATALFAFQQPFLPVESDPVAVTYHLAFLEGATDRGCPGLDVMHYALDAALPVIDLGQDQRCRFTPEGPLRLLWLLLHSVYVIAGAALSAVVVLTLTGVLRED
jgi:hypothetical protein